MYALFVRKTKSGEVVNEKIDRLERVVFFDEAGARIQVDKDCCVRKPVAPKNVDIYIERE